MTLPSAGPSLEPSLPRCVVTDLDRTLTDRELRLDPAASARIDALRAAGVRVVVATGRRFDDVARMGLLPRVDGVVAENGAVVCLPDQHLFQAIGPAFGGQARGALRDLAASFTWGRVVGSGPRGLADEASRRLDAGGVPHALAFNAGEVMLLPPRLDKATGAAMCLHRLGILPQEAWAIGDGENDVTLLEWAGVSAAPANAAPAAREAADVQLVAPFAQGFLDFTEYLLPAPAR